MAELCLSVDVDASPADVWAAATDWRNQSAWMLGTVVTPVAGGGQGVGGRITARTAVLGVGFDDPMRITVWDPPRRCLVVHEGRVVRGSGLFEVVDLGNGRSRFVWSEWLELPLGLVGQVGWLLLRPVFALGVQLSLRRFATWAARRSAAVPDERPGLSA